MISKELKRLSRRELVDIIYQLKKNEEKMQEEIAGLEEALQEKRIRISMAGSIAEAAMDITNIFSSAQTTADLYLREIACMKEDAERECAKMIDEANKKVEKTLQDGARQFADLKARYQIAYDRWQQLQAEIERLEKMKSVEQARE